LFLGDNVSGYAVGTCLEHRATALAVATSLLRRPASRAALVRLLGLHDDLLQAITLLVGAAVLHLRHCLLHVSEPSVCHFCLTARNKTTRTRCRTEIPLTTVRIHIIHYPEPREGLIGCDDGNV
jgi:hypothetical protein